MKGMTTCKVCGRDFALMQEEHYTAKDTGKMGVIANLTNADKALIWDAFDCPYCGCQNLMQERKPFNIPEKLEIVGEHDGCYGCAYEDLDFSDEPCVSCKYTHRDNYKKKEESDE